MKILTDEEIDRNFGTENFLDPRRLEVPSLKYAGGIKSINEMLKHCDPNKCLSQNILDKSNCSIHLTEKGLIITITTGWSKFKTGIHLEDINSWVIENQEEIIAKKYKSIVGRALLGGLLNLPHMDPVGLEVGKITDSGNKNVQYNILVCSIKGKNEGENEVMIFFSCQNKDLEIVHNFLKFNFEDILMRSR
jgi:hypothetical protein